VALLYLIPLIVVKLLDLDYEMKSLLLSFLQNLDILYLFRRAVKMRLSFISIFGTEAL